MELRPRKDRNSSSSKLPPPSPMSERASVQCGSAHMTRASLPSYSKTPRARKSSSSIGPRTLIYLSSEEEDTQMVENSLLKKKDADRASAQNASRPAAPMSPITVSSTGFDLKEVRGSHKTDGIDATPQSRLEDKGRLRSSTRRKMPAKVPEEVDAIQSISKVGQEGTSMRLETTDTILPESNSMGSIKRSVSKLDDKGRKRTGSKSVSQRQHEINRKLFEDVLNGEIETEDTNCRRIELFQENRDEQGETILGETQGNPPSATVLIANDPNEKFHQSHENLSGVKELTNIIHSATSNLVTIPIANGLQEKANLSPVNLTNMSAGAERTTLMQMLPERHGYQAADGKEPNCRSYEDEVEKATSLGEKEVLTTDMRQTSCKNLQEIILGQEQSEQGNGGSIRCEGYERIGSVFKQEADILPENRLKERNAALRENIEQKVQEHLDDDCDRSFCSKSGETTSCHRVNSQELSLDDDAHFCKFKGDRDEKDTENQGLTFSGKKETAHLDAFTCLGSDRITDSGKGNEIEQVDNDSNGTIFQESCSDWKMKKKEEDSNDDENKDSSDNENEDEVEMAKLFVRSLKAHLQPISDQSGLANMQKDVAAKVGKSEEEENIYRKVAPKKVGQITSNGSRLPSIGLSWTETGLLATKTDKCSGRDFIGKLKGVPENIWQKEGKLIDGLLVPPVDPRKLNKYSRKQTKDTAGAKWYDLSAPTVTPELKKELQLLKLRNVIDPRRHYKSEDSKGLPKYFQVGTVVGGPADFYSGRLTKKEKKNTFSDELLSDSILSGYRKRKYTEIQEQKQAGGKKFWKKKESKRTPSWART